MAKRKYGSKSRNFLAFVLCLPLAFIVYFLISYSSQSISLDNVKKITVLAPNEENMVFESKEDIDFFVDVLTDARSISTAIRDVAGETPVYITCGKEDKAVEYKLYPSLNLSGCLLVAPEGNLYVLNTEDARQLLLRSEFDYLYSSLFLPKLSVVSGDTVTEVLPTDCNWTYLKSDGNTYNYSPVGFSDGTDVFTILKGQENKLVFGNGDRVPDENFNISFVSENGTEFESIKDISDLNLSVDTNVNITIIAKWSNRNNAQSYGEARYKFSVLYDVPAEISISETELILGDVIEINASHLNANEILKLETLLSYRNFDFGMVDKNSGVALIPIGLDNESGIYSLKLSTPTSSVEETVTIEGLVKSDEFIRIDATKEQYDSMLSTDVMKEFNNKLSELTETRPEKDYFNYAEGTLSAPIRKGKIKYGFGRTINIGVTEAVMDTGVRVVEGVVYSVSKDKDVRSAQAGVVVFAGELAPTGNTVVIYHGYGIYTYYYNLESIDEDIQTGTEVNNSQVIGVAGTTGFTSGDAILHYAVSIDGVFVNPQWFE